jgi:o-succinylbenzoate synthase
VQLTGIELRMVALALRAPIGTAVGPHVTRPVIYVRVATDEGEGWGECAALASGTAVDPSVDEMWRELTEHSVPAFVAAVAASGGALPDAAEVRHDVDTPVGRMGTAALEMAVLDARLRASGTSLAAHLGAPSREVSFGALVGIPADHDLGVLRAGVEAAVSRGVRRVRVKIAPGWDRVPLEAVRTAFPTLALQADANGSYRMGSDGMDGVATLRVLDRLGLGCIEQPLAPDDLEAHRALAAMLDTAIGLDESLSSLPRIKTALAAGACEVACIKPARIGGLAAAARAVALARNAGVAAFVGGFFETGLARAANAALAGLSDWTLPGDVGPPSDYLVEDPCGYGDVAEGLVEVRTAPGVGPAPSAPWVRRHTVRTASIDAAR